MTKYLDDHFVGEKMRSGPYHVTVDDVLEYARKFARPIEEFDDPERIRTSGCHTISIFQLLQVDMGFANDSAEAMLAALAIDELRWLTPVHSGDALEAEFEVLDVIASRSQPDRGVLKSRYNLYNQNGDVALTLISTIMMQRRPR